MKLLSIIIPSYNMEHYLGNAVESLLVGESEQDLLDVIIVNDGSKDTTSEIAHTYERNHTGIISVIDKENGHYGSCINAALKVATGEFVRVLDADDSFDTVNFRAYLEFLKSMSGCADFSSVDCILTDARRVNEKGVELSYETVPLPASRVLSKNQIPGHFVFQMYAETYRTSMLRSNGYVQTEGILYTDTEWMAYPLTWVRKLYYWSGKPVYKYLIGRIGQSVDPAVLRRGTSQRIQMFGRMLRASRNDQLPSADRYRLKTVSESGIMAVFRKTLECSDLVDVNDSIREIDEMVLSVGEDVYAYLNNVPLTRYIRIPFMRLWRRNGRLTVPVMVLTRMILRIDGLFGPLRNVLRRLMVKSC